MIAKDAAISGMRVETVRLRVSANNVANRNTDGFKAGRVEAVAQAEGGVEPRVSVNDAPGPKEMRENELVELSNVDLVDERIAQTAAAASFRANLKAIQTADQMTGTLIDSLG